MVYLVLWQIAILLDLHRPAVIGFALYGFVFHVIFGKAYALVPAYFDRHLVTPWGPRLQLPLTATGAMALSVAPLVETTRDLTQIGFILWVSGAAIFFATLVGTIGTNLHGGETGTGEVNRHRQHIDRFANAFVPIALAYFVVGSYEALAGVTVVPSVVIAVDPQITHLFAAGMATLLVFAIGSRLLPRFFVAHVPRPLVFVMLTSGAVAPALLVVGFGNGFAFLAGAVLLWIGMTSYTISVIVLASQTDRRRVGFIGVGLGALAGFLGVGVGVFMVLVGQTVSLIAIHIRILTLGFLALTIIGVLFQFYPPSIGTLPAVSDRSALASIVMLAIGLAVEVIGLIGAAPSIMTAGRVLVVLGATGAAWILVALTIERGA